MAVSTRLVKITDRAIIQKMDIIKNLISQLENTVKQSKTFYNVVQCFAQREVHQREAIVVLEEAGFLDRKVEYIAGLSTRLIDGVMYAGLIAISLDDPNLVIKPISKDHFIAALIVAALDEKIFKGIDLNDNFTAKLTEYILRDYSLENRVTVFDYTEQIVVILPNSDLYEDDWFEKLVTAN